MKILPVGAELVHVDGRTDTTKLTVAFIKFANASKDKRNHNFSDLRRQISSKTVNLNKAASNPL